MPCLKLFLCVVMSSHFSLLFLILVFIFILFFYLVGQNIISSIIHSWCRDLCPVLSCFRCIHPSAMLCLHCLLPVVLKSSLWSSVSLALGPQDLGIEDSTAHPTWFLRGQLICLVVLGRIHILCYSDHQPSSQRHCESSWIIMRWEQ